MMCQRVPSSTVLTDDVRTSSSAEEGRVGMLFQSRKLAELARVSLARPLTLNEGSTSLSGLVEGDEAM